MTRKQFDDWTSTLDLDKVASTDMSFCLWLARALQDHELVFLLREPPGEWSWVARYQGRSLSAVAAAKSACEAANGCLPAPSDREVPV